eukprot:m.476081 g.476081  ORF g.476081 m.476081 type:complete len:220 (-) comp40032_c0_seq1:185-844(-)
MAQPPRLGKRCSCVWPPSAPPAVDASTAAAAPRKKKQSKAAAPPVAPNLSATQRASIPGRVYVSNAEAARDRALLAHLDIAAVISVGGGHGAAGTPEVQYLHFGIKDRAEADYTAVLREAVAFARPVLGAGKSVLVHCLRGMHRSPTVAAAILVSEGGLSAAEAMGCVKAARPAVYFAGHLAQQLDAYSRECAGLPTLPLEDDSEGAAAETKSVDASTD